MEFDFSWLLLGLPLAFVLGWLASRLDLRQLRLENRQTPKAYFKGLNHLLNEQQDQAIDAFIEAVQHDPDTSELHFALGNLFRRRGEFERAVRVHQHLVARGDLSQADRDRAQYALALDYLKAGLLDRAEAALRKLEGTAHQTQAHLALLGIYERARDWTPASAIAQRLQSAGAGSFQHRIAHYLCEQAATLAYPADAATMERLLRQAIETAPQSPRPRMALARLQQQQGAQAAAFATWTTLAHDIPAALPLLARPLVELAEQTGRVDEALNLLGPAYERNPSLDLLQALAQLHRARGDASSAEAWLRHLTRERSLVAAHHWLRDSGQNLPEPVLQALERATKPLQRYRCAACGFEASQHFWQCPGCQAWDSYPARRVEEL
ncbi:MAG: lipopolysaccharide assembly protein LapB [Limnohabitans sp.]|jgi:lipopolysaccharide biosynthesis regulator YciM|nr:lipopolysaccharide assembly protein LapB [Limnohabitans sp.]